MYFLDNNTNVFEFGLWKWKILLNAQNNKLKIWQLHIIISDGILEDHELIQRLIRRCYEKEKDHVGILVFGYWWPRKYFGHATS